MVVALPTTYSLTIIDRSLKVKNIGQDDYKFERIIPELDKCRLLCSDCHAVKTRAEGDNNKTLKGYDLDSIVNEGDTITITYKLNNTHRAEE